ncbi:GntR family transcriptional regulator [Kitasatospora sp. NPDC001309]|uniref:GntR family transcriptional regulator n=1 Tax=Kitasatospora sp. NPDC001309 TaxID=3364013 RepID=UPI0036983CBC
MTPKYRRIADTIRSRIRGGDYPAGSDLPKDAELAAELGETRPTVAQAMGVLATEGLVIRSSAGSKVHPIMRKITRVVPDRYEAAYRERGHGAFDVEVRECGYTPRWETTVTETADETVKHYRMWADGVPVQFATGRSPKTVADAAGTAVPDTGPGGIISRMADAGYRQVKMREEIDVRTPSEPEAAFLGLTLDQLVYEITHTGYTADGATVETVAHVLPVHLWQLVHTWTPDGGAA